MLCFRVLVPQKTLFGFRVLAIHPPRFFGVLGGGEIEPRSRTRHPVETFGLQAVVTGGGTPLFLPFFFENRFLGGWFGWFFKKWNPDFDEMEGGG